MNGNIYEMLNDSKIDLDNYIVETSDDLEKANMKKKFRASINKNKVNKTNKVKVAAVVMLLTIGFLVTTYDESVLAAINIISTDIATKLGINKNLDDYKTVVNKTVTDNGITIKLNEVILDGNKLIVSTTIKLQDPIDGVDAIHPSGSIKINGKKAGFASGGSSKEIDAYTLEVITEFILNETYSNGDLEIEINYKDDLLHGNTLKGEWSFAFKTSGEKLAAKTKSITLNHKVTLENGVELNLYKYTTNDLGQKIFFTKTQVKNEELYDVVLKGSDNLGNKVEFRVSGQEKDKGTFVIKKPSLSEQATEITLTPYAVKFPEEGGKMSNDYVKIGEEFKINLVK